MVKLVRTGSAEEYDDSVFLSAVYFTVFRRWGVGPTQQSRVRFDDFSAACLDAADTTVNYDRHGTVYAVTADDQSVPLHRDRWGHYLELWCKKKGIELKR